PDIGNDGGLPPKISAPAKELEFLPPIGRASAAASDEISTRVRVDIFEAGSTDERNAESYFEPAFAFPVLPKKYNNKGVIADRPTPFMLRAISTIALRQSKWQ